MVNFCTAQVALPYFTKEKVITESGKQKLKFGHTGQRFQPFWLIFPINAYKISRNSSGRDKKASSYFVWTNIYWHKDQKAADHNEDYRNPQGHLFNYLKYVIYILLYKAEASYLDWSV